MIKTNFLTDFDLHLYAKGSHYRLYEKMGAHLVEQDGVKGVHFAVWAPSAERVSVVGDFNNWQAGASPLEQIALTGVWTAFVADVKEGFSYKYHVTPKNGMPPSERSDPFGFFAEVRPKTASIVWDLNKYQWKDKKWMETRGQKNRLDAPISIYEVHLGSWMRVPEEGNRWLTYRELADKLTVYVKDMGFTHVEFLPIAEHPLDLSWGYQTIGYFAPTSRFGEPEDLMYLIDTLHQNDIGVLIDWVPAHFPKDGHGLGEFDGTHLYEHADPRQGEHKEWGTYVFNFGRYEVEDFLTSNAFFWLDKYHIDGVRVDAVASMLYLDYGRKDGEWLANPYGGRECIEAIDFLKRLNERIYSNYPDVMTMAEESTAWPLVSRPTYLGGLGFQQKWDMGWMHDMLEYMAMEPIYRKYHHNKLTFRGLYAFSENFVLPLSHDEVVYGKRSLLNKMPGDEWQRFANLRLLFGNMYTIPAKKLLFMGGEFGQWNEWNHAASLDWHLTDNPMNRGVQNWLRDLNHYYKNEPALYEQDCLGAGFEWVDCSDYESSIINFLRFAKDRKDMVLVVCNFTPVVRHNYLVGVPVGGAWNEVLNSDASSYGGSGVGNYGVVHSFHGSMHGKHNILSLTLPPLAVLVLKPQDWHA
ncbi:MAG: 1,4-alpha-glucan branching protein GlgB [Candidatus Obscuribacterales bacterium]|nr:1,4-alpha-glucan branching protein GlgB [Candidatus Obscuribacterales bacterium]